MSAPSSSQHIESLQQRFQSSFSAQHGSDVHSFFAPGRVNLIGDHTDYTGGFVFPCGTDSGSTLLIRRTNNNQFGFASTNFEFTASLPSSDITKPHDDKWINYPMGVIDQFTKRGFNIDGLDCLFSGNVPNGAGLSSSASIEVVTAFAINELFDCKLPLIELIKLSQAAENDFVGMQCGIMDQFAVAMAQENHAIFLNCSSLEHRQVPLQLDGLSIVLANTNQRRELNDSAYNQRVAECTRALGLLKTQTAIASLGELDLDTLENHKMLFESDLIAYQRALHVVSENTRVMAAIPALEQGQLEQFGSLMNSSHDSLNDLYEVSSDPLNHLVNIAREQPGVIGSRMTGGGFGGCTVNLVRNEHLASFIENVGNLYQAKADLTADFYTISPSNGVRRINT